MLNRIAAPNHSPYALTDGDCADLDYLFLSDEKCLGKFSQSLLPPVSARLSNQSANTYPSETVPIASTIHVVPEEAGALLHSLEASVIEGFVQDAEDEYAYSPSYSRDQRGRLASFWDAVPSSPGEEPQQPYTLAYWEPPADPKAPPESYDPFISQPRSQPLVLESLSNHGEYTSDIEFLPPRRDIKLDWSKARQPAAVTDPDATKQQARDIRDNINQMVNAYFAQSKETVTPRMPQSASGDQLNRIVNRYFDQR